MDRHILAKGLGFQRQLGLKVSQFTMNIPADNKAKEGKEDIKNYSHVYMLIDY